MRRMRRVKMGRKRGWWEKESARGGFQRGMNEESRGEYGAATPIANSEDGKIMVWFRRPYCFSFGILQKLIWPVPFLFCTCFVSGAKDVLGGGRDNYCVNVTPLSQLRLQAALDRLFAHNKGKRVKDIDRNCCFHYDHPGWTMPSSGSKTINQPTSDKRVQTLLATPGNRKVT